MRKWTNLRCVKCNGMPNQHNVRQPVILTERGKYAQHGFVFGGES